jgi:hypothetical protein
LRCCKCPADAFDIIRKRAEHLGAVEAATKKEAIEKAAERIDMSCGRTELRCRR